MNKSVLTHAQYGVGGWGRITISVKPSLKMSMYASKHVKECKLTFLNIRKNGELLAFDDAATHSQQLRVPLHHQLILGHPHPTMEDQRIRFKYVLQSSSLTHWLAER